MINTLANLLTLKICFTKNCCRFSLAKLMHNCSKLFVSNCSKPKISNTPIEIRPFGEDLKIALLILFTTIRNILP